MVKAYYPQTIREALELKKTLQEDALPIMGGSDIMVKGNMAQHVLFLSFIRELGRVECTGTHLIIGAGCTYANLIHNENIPEFFRNIMKQIASPAVRNVGTLVGNICNASPAGDTLPALYAMDAVVVAVSLDSEEKLRERRIPIDQFITGVRRINLEPGEIVTAVEIPRSSYEGMTILSHNKVGARKAEAIAKISFVGIMKLHEDKVEDIRIAFGAMGPTVIRSRELEETISNMSVGELMDNREKIAEEYDQILHPIDDQRSTKEYRRRVCRNLLCEFLKCEESTL